MITLSREGKYSLSLRLEKADIHSLKSAFEAALRGEAATLEIELAGQVLGRRWSPPSRKCDLRVVCSESDGIFWDSEGGELSWMIDPDSLQMAAERLGAALESGYFYPAEMGDFQVMKRAQPDSVYVLAV
ncbi:hypothetical protein EON80_23135 [bacterium]|nr:MAG: hypothetical protein EON80_23135 [bacterium]